jgi:hypothetical protein
MDEKQLRSKLIEENKELLMLWLESKFEAIDKNTDARFHEITGILETVCKAAKSVEGFPRCVAKDGRIFAAENELIEIKAEAKESKGEYRKWVRTITIGILLLLATTILNSIWPKDCKSVQSHTHERAQVRQMPKQPTTNIP